MKKSNATTDKLAVQPRPGDGPSPTTLSVENQEAADREVAQRERLASEGSDNEKRRDEAEKHPGKPFQPARDALNKFDEEVRNMRDADREHWKPSEMRRLRDEAMGVVRRLEDMVTGDAD